MLAKAAHLRRSPLDGTGLPPYYLPVTVVCMCCALVYCIAFVQLSGSLGASTAGNTGVDEAPMGEESMSAVTQTPPSPPTEIRRMRYELEGPSAESARRTPSYGRLTQTVGAFEDKGYSISFVLRNLSSDKEISYDAERDYYPASSIKGPYVTSLYQMLVEPGVVPLDDVSDLAALTILYSDNDAYSELREIHDGEPFAQWLHDAGVTERPFVTYEDFTHWNYPRICTRQLAQMWVHVNAYLDSGTEPAKQLRNLFLNREVAPIRDAISSAETPSVGKAGWMDVEDEESGAAPSATEAGIVYTRQGNFLIAIMSDAPAEFEDVLPVINALFQTRVALV